MCMCTCTCTCSCSKLSGLAKLRCEHKQTFVKMSWDTVIMSFNTEVHTYAQGQAVALHDNKTLDNSTKHRR